jgi:hypothetical protein
VAGTAMVGLGTILGAVAGAVVVLVIEIVAMVAVFDAVAHKIFDVSKAFADYASKIGKLSEETGLSTQTVAALNLELEKGGKNFNEIKPSITNFTKVLAEASAGIEDAKKKAVSLGLDPKTAINNLDQSFRSAISTILKINDPLKQAQAASDAFGDNWKAILPLFRDGGGDVDKLVASMHGLNGVTAEQAAQAKLFERNYTDLQQTLNGLKNFFGQEFLPKVTEALQAVDGWLIRNKDSVKGWADWTVSWVQTAIDRWTTFFNLIDKINHLGTPNPLPPDQQRMINSAEITQGTRPYDQSAPSASAASVVQTQEEIDNQTASAKNSIDQAMEYLQAAVKKADEERKQHQKDELDAQIQLYQMQVTRLEQSFDEGFKEITENFKKTGNVSEYQNAFAGLQKMLHDVGGKLTSDWQKAVNDRVGLETKGQKQIELIHAETQEKIDALSQKNYEATKQAAKVVSDVQKKAAEDALNNYKSTLDRRTQLDAANTQAGLAAAKLKFDKGGSTEKAYLDFVETAERGDLLLKISRADDWLSHVRGNLKLEGDAQNQLDILKAQLAEHDAKRDDAAELRKKALNQQYEDLKQNLQDEINEMVTGKPLSEYEKMVRSVDKAYKDLNPDQKESLKTFAAQKDAINEQKEAVKALQEEYDKVRDQIRGMLDDVLHGDFKNLGRTLLDQARNAVSDRLSTVFTNIIFGGNPHETNNPIAKPIVKEITGTNQRLDRLIAMAGGTPVGGIGSLGATIGGINGGSLGGLGGGRYGGLIDAINQLPATGAGQPPANRGILSQIFGKGGLFGDKGFGNNLGTYQGVGALGSLAGGLVGGRVGGLISSTASGLGIGAQIGSLFGPVGTAVGAVVGAVGGRRKRRTKSKIFRHCRKGFRTR